MGSRPQFSEAQALAGAALKTFSQATHHSVSLDQMGRQTHGPGRQHDQLLHRDVGDYDPISLTAATMTTAGTEVPAGRACLQNDQPPVDLSSHQIRCSYGPGQHLHPRLPGDTAPNVLAVGLGRRCQQGGLGQSRAPAPSDGSQGRPALQRRRTLPLIRRCGPHLLI